MPQIIVAVPYILWLLIARRHSSRLTTRESTQCSSLHQHHRRSIEGASLLYLLWRPRTSPDPLKSSDRRSGQCRLEFGILDGMNANNAAELGLRRKGDFALSDASIATAALSSYHLCQYRVGQDEDCLVYNAIQNP